MSFPTIAFDNQDMGGRAVSRTLLQFRKAPVFQALLAAMVSEIQVFSDAAVDVMKLRTPAEATGYNLEVIGDIVGCLRTLFDYGRLNWFSPDTVGYPPDSSFAWVKNAPIGVLQSPDDGLYRQMIEFKVLRNFTRYASIPEIQEAMYTAFGVHISFQAVVDSDMDWYLIISRNTPQHIQNFLTHISSNEFSENIYMVPYPISWRIVGILYLEDL